MPNYKWKINLNIKNPVNGNLNKVGELQLYQVTGSTKYYANVVFKYPEKNVNNDAFDVWSDLEWSTTITYPVPNTTSDILIQVGADAMAYINAWMGANADGTVFTFQGAWDGQSSNMGGTNSQPTGSALIPRTLWNSWPTSLTGRSAGPSGSQRPDDQGGGDDDQPATWDGTGS